MERTVTATVGLPGSGKSTWAAATLSRHAEAPWEVVRLNRDALRAMLHAGRWAGAATEQQVTALERVAIRTCFARGASWVIIDDTNMEPRTLADWRTEAIGNQAHFEVRSFLGTPLDECVQRDALRYPPARVGEEVIHNMHERHGARIRELLDHWASAGIAPVHEAVLVP